jgi:hypothetical protein
LEENVRQWTPLGAGKEGGWIGNTVAGKRRAVLGVPRILQNHVSPDKYVSNLILKAQTRNIQKS